MASAPDEYSSFWSWFQFNEADFPSTDKFDALFGTELSGRLADIRSGLTYEIAIREDGDSEFIISADGIKELIPFVQELVNSAPALDGWKIIAFRPRQPDYSDFTLEFAGRNVDPKTLWCRSQVEDGNFDLIVYHPNYSEDDRSPIVASTYILLDMALGELDVMTHIRYIDHQQLPDDAELKGLYRFEELRDIFDTYKSTITH